MAKGPLAENVWEVPESPFKEVMPEPPAPMQVPLGKQTFPVPRIWRPPWKVEVADDVANICPKLGEEEALVVNV